MNTRVPNRSSYDQGGLLETVGYGVGTLAFLLAPMLIPGVSPELAVLESSMLAFAAYVCIILFAVGRSLRRPARRRPM